MQGKVFYANRGSRVGGERLKGGVEKRKRKREGEREGERERVLIEYKVVYLCSAVLCIIRLGQVRSMY